MNTVNFVYTEDRPHYSGQTLRRLSKEERNNVLRKLEKARADAVYEYLCSINNGGWIAVSFNKIKKEVCTTKQHAMDAIQMLVDEHKIETIRGVGKRANQYLIV